MALATVTVRELKNKTTGLDLSVTSYKETKGLIGVNYEYQVMVVTNLPYFKSSKHKHTDNVQFTVFKKFNEFEDLYTKLNTKYCGTALPAFPKRVVLMTESVTKERRAGLDKLLKFLAVTPKLCYDSELLTFLGVTPLKAGKLKKIEVSDSVVDRQTSSESVDEHASILTESDALPENVEEDENLFETNTNDDKAASYGDNDEDLFGFGNVSSEPRVVAKLYEAPDLSGALEAGLDDGLLIASAMLEPANQSETLIEVGDQDDSLDIFKQDEEDEDLKQIMHMKFTIQETKKENSELQNNESTEKMVDTLVKLKPAPAPRQKPVVPNNIEQSKSSIDSSKPLVKERQITGLNSGVDIHSEDAFKQSDQSQLLFEDSSNQSDVSFETAGKTNITKSEMPLKPKPPLRQKPLLAKKPSLQSESVKSELQQTPGKQEVVQLNPVPPVLKQVTSGRNEKRDNEGAIINDITEDDIMKYIQENTVQDGNDNLDLFS